jgi:hypothetical protein
MLLETLGVVRSQARGAVDRLTALKHATAEATPKRNYRTRLGVTHRIRRALAVDPRTDLGPNLARGLHRRRLDQRQIADGLVFGAVAVGTVLEVLTDQGLLGVPEGSQRMSREEFLNGVARVHRPSLPPALRSASAC